MSGVQADAIGPIKTPLPIDRARSVRRWKSRPVKWPLDKPDSIVCAVQARSSAR